MEVLEHSLNSEKRLLQTQKRSRMRHRMENTGGDLGMRAVGTWLEVLSYSASPAKKPL